MKSNHSRLGLIERYRSHLDIPRDTDIVSLQEGSTPLIEAPKLSEKLGARILLKFEGLNPTGSFKDRGMTMAVTMAKAEGAKAVVCASTGNTAASASAYAARAGLRGVVVVPEGKIAAGKLAQSLMHGALVISLRGNFDQALDIVRDLTERYPIALVNSINPHRLEGQKTAAFEICDELGEAPDALAIPVGNGGNITAYWKGFREYKVSPVLCGFQAEGAAPIVRGEKVEKPETIASAIRIGNPARWKEAQAAIDESGGMARMVSDQEILDAYRFVASEDGVFCEPSCAAPLAGLLKYGLPTLEDGSAPGTVVCVLTGHGLKDPDTAIAEGPSTVSAEANTDEVARAVFGEEA